MTCLSCGMKKELRGSSITKWSPFWAPLPPQMERIRRNDGSAAETAPPLGAGALGCWPNDFGDNSTKTTRAARSGVQAVVNFRSECGGTARFLPIQRFDIFIEFADRHRIANVHPGVDTIDAMLNSKIRPLPASYCADTGVDLSMASRRSRRRMVSLMLSTRLRSIHSVQTYSRTTRPL